MSTAGTDTIFNKKYSEFCDDLLGACPEYEKEILAAKALVGGERERLYKELVLKKVARLPDQNPGVVLPGVTIADSIWSALSEKSHKAILDYLRLLDVSCVFLNIDVSGVENISQEWVDSILRDWRSRMDRVDFQSISDKFMNMFGSQGGNLPPLPERFLNGKLAKLAEDMVREFRPEDFGLTPEDVAACETDPTRAFEILMQASAQNPDNLQKVMMRVAKKLQAKIQSGALKPQELAAEAEELIKEFQNHPAFVEMLQSFRNVFSTEDPENVTRMGGDDGDKRLAIARARLRKKMEARKQGKK